MIPQEDLRKACEGTKREIVELCMRGGKTGAHLGGTMSLAEILTVLFCRYYREERGDRFVLSKGHGGLAMYAAMHQAGLLTDEELSRPLLGEDTFLYKHPVRNAEKGIQFTGGSLGQGLAFALGQALALKMKRSSGRVFVLLGDGELDEGSVWEALSVIGHRALRNLFVLVDANGLQLSGRIEEIQKLEPLPERFASFGISCMETDGHDIAAVDNALSKLEEGPAAIVFRTKKGNGIPFAEDRIEWHSKAMTEEQYAIARKALGEGER